MLVWKNAVNIFCYQFSFGSSPLVVWDGIYPKASSNGQMFKSYQDSSPIDDEKRHGKTSTDNLYHNISLTDRIES